MGVVFVAAGVVALLSTVLLASNAAAALPWAVVSWPLTIFAGYRVWRGANPTTSVRREIAVRGRAAVASIAGVSIVLVATAFPQLLAVVVGIWAAVLVVLFVALAWAGRKGSGS